MISELAIESYMTELQLYHMYYSMYNYVAVIAAAVGLCEHKVSNTQKDHFLANGHYSGYRELSSGWLPAFFNKPQKFSLELEANKVLHRPSLYAVFSGPKTVQSHDCSQLDVCADSSTMLFWFSTAVSINSRKLCESYPSRISS